MENICIISNEYILIQEMKLPLCLKTNYGWTSLMVQWLRLRASNAGGAG